FSCGAPPLHPAHFLEKWVKTYCANKVLRNSSLNTAAIIFFRKLSFATELNCVFNLILWLHYKGVPLGKLAREARLKGRKAPQEAPFRRRERRHFP
ncbi:MAG: hypothetical protein IJ062_07420, partial [Firmicutes bacterium]|nr:hypothetical protein [Bacillota bacterium]